MKVLLQENLQATAVEIDKKFYPAIDDGEAVYYFTAYIYGNRENAVSHAKQTIKNLQKLLDNHLENWHLSKWNKVKELKELKMGEMPSSPMDF